MNIWNLLVRTRAIHERSCPQAEIIRSIPGTRKDPLLHLQSHRFMLSFNDFPYLTMILRDRQVPPDDKFRTRLCPVLTCSISKYSIFSPFSSYPRSWVQITYGQPGWYKKLFSNSKKRDQKIGRFRQDTAAILGPFLEYLRKVLILWIASKQSIHLDFVVQALNQVLKIKGDKFALFIQDVKNIPYSMTQMLRVMTGDPKIAPRWLTDCHSFLSYFVNSGSDQIESWFILFFSVIESK
jgi:hypothetical protein